MSMFNIKTKSPSKCDNKAKINIRVNSTEKNGVELKGGAVFVSFLEGGVWHPVGDSPYGNGCEEFRADIGCDWKVKPVAAPGFKCTVGRAATYKMGKVSIEKKFFFECLTC